MASLVHIVDDDAQVRAATSFLLASHGYTTEVYSSGTEFLRDARLTRGCILLDLRMPGLDGHEVQEELRRRGVDLPVVIMSGHGDVDAAVQAMKLGAFDYLSKPAREEDLFGAIERALSSHRETEVRRAAAANAAARLQSLSPRERQILQGLLGGLSNKEIARCLVLSPRTVEMHRANMMDDLGITNLAEALRLGIDAGLPPLTGAEETAAAPPARFATPPMRPVAGASALKGEALRLVVESSSDGAWEWRLASGEVRLSPTIIARLGYSEAEAVDHFDALQSLIHPDDRDLFVEELDAHLNGRTKGFAAEFRVRRKDGSWAWLFDYGNIVERDAHGAPVRMAGSLSDISRRKEEEQKAREASELLELAKWGAAAGIWELDIESRRLRLSARSRELHKLPGDTAEWMSECDWLDMVHPEDREATRAEVQRATTTGAPWMIEYRNLDGDRLLGLGKIVRDADGRPRRMLGLGQKLEAQAPFRLGGSHARMREAADA